MSQPTAISTDGRPAPGTAPSSGTARSLETVRALQTQLEYFIASESYDRVIRTKVLDKVPPEVARAWSGELGKKHQERMLSLEFQRLLAIIWKESDFVTLADLEAVGAERNFQPGTLNCNSLGCLIAAGKEKVNAATQRVTAFVAIAVRYGLVEQVHGKSKRIELRATEALHDVMLAIGPPAMTDALASSTSTISAFNPIDGR